MNVAFWKRSEARDAYPVISFDDWVDMLTTFSYQGVQYTMPGAKQEEVGASYSGFARSAYKANGVVFACILVRMLLFSEARFQFRRLSGRVVQPGGRGSAGRSPEWAVGETGESIFRSVQERTDERDMLRYADAVAEMRAGDLFGTPDLAVLEQPWPGGTTGDLLTKMLLHVDLGGNAFVLREGNRLSCLRPDWTTLLVGSSRDGEAAAWDPDAEVLAYSYKPGGAGSGTPAELYDASRVAHFAPIPDPEAQFRGMSWLTPMIREVMADKAGTDHKLAFLENGAVRNQVIKLDTEDLEVYRNWIEEYKTQHSGARNKFKTIFLGAGTDTTTVGVDMRELDFKTIQAAGETRIAATAGVPPVIVGLSEGLASATYSNYGQARRRFADGTLRPLWRNAAGSLAKLLAVPAGSELWYDTRDISFLREDEKDNSEILQANAVAIKTLVDAGYDPDSVVQAIAASDLSRLQHTGLVSVQLQEPGAAPPTGTPAPALNGANGSRDDVKHVEFPDGRVLTVTTS